MCAARSVCSFLNLEELRHLLQAFPKVDFAFAYGSGVFEQQGYNYAQTAQELPMLDMVFGVKDSRSWHADNLQRNPGHYSSLARLLGAKGVAHFQEGYGAKLYYNPLVPISGGPHKGRMMKYGTISLDHLMTDLRKWRWMYAAGRMHKPVRIIQGVDHTEVMAAAEDNLVQATGAALLTLPATFTEEQLYQAIAGLSYTGDFRMAMGENPLKVTNIVTKNIDRFRSLYARTLQVFPGLCAKRHDGGEFEQDMSLAARRGLVQRLPSLIQAGVGPGQDLEGVGVRLSKTVTSIVGPSSRRQALKGLLTAGVWKSAKYSLAKIQKKLQLPG